MVLLTAAEYRPDMAALNSGYTDQLVNVLPAANGYIPMKDWAGLSKPLPEPVLAAFAARALDQSVHIFAGSGQNLFLLDNRDLSWREVSKAKAAYHATREAGWSFAAFGNHVLAVNQNDPPQVLQLGKDATFRDLKGTPPRAGLVRIWGDFVCLMQLPDFPNRVHWSGLNDCEFWTVGKRSCDFQDFPEGGRVQGSTEATNPLIFLQSTIYAGTFVPGSAIIFSFRKVQDKRGAKSPRGIACRGAEAFFADEGGFFQISADGSQLQPIGYEKLDRTIFSRIAAANLAEISAVIDPFHARVYWAMDYNGTGSFNEMLVYDWGVQQWSLVQIAASHIVPFYTAGYTLEGLDAVAKSLEALPFPLDAKAWQGGAPLLGAFRNDRLGSFTAANMEAVLVSQEIAAANGQMQRCRRLQPLVDTDQFTCSIGQRSRRNAHEPVRWTPEASPSFHTGMLHKRVRGRYLRFRIRIPAGEVWTHLSGFEVELSEAGQR